MNCKQQGESQQDSWYRQIDIDKSNSPYLQLSTQKFRLCRCDLLQIFFS